VREEVLVAKIVSVNAAAFGAAERRVLDRTTVMFADGSAWSGARTRCVIGLLRAMQ